MTEVKSWAERLAARAMGGEVTGGEQEEAREAVQPPAPTWARKAAERMLTPREDVEEPPPAA
ncbi:hypothetical protein [Streptomyces sp. 4N124]|uniref:hypothetical protein n=1 Tax=Streptomyces sp. 4N124 TaxID=3457420 RepID=UPI003FD048C9